MLTYIQLFMIIIVLCTSTYVDASEWITNKLTGGSHKTWQVEAFDIKLGSGTKCTTGIQYTFKSDHTLELQSCVNTDIETVSYSWESTFDGIDIYISFGGITYRIIYSKRLNDIGIDEEELVLRIEGSKEKPTYDIVMSHIP
jgi:hypothetical protein